MNNKQREYLVTKVEKYEEKIEDKKVAANIDMVIIGVGYVIR